MGLFSRRNQDDELIHGEPSVLGRQRTDNEQADEPQSTDTVGGQTAAEQAGDPHAEVNSLDTEAVITADPPEGVRDQLERLASQIRGLQDQVEVFVSRRNDVVADQASQRVAAIVHAAEESAAEISADAQREAIEFRGRLVSEAQAEAERIRVQAQADASKIRTEAHAAAAR